jgi:hypothetical protein
METILCAAIWYINRSFYKNQPKDIEYGYVMCGYRHNDIIRLHTILTHEATRSETSIQGFITSENRFVDRKEAKQIAIAAGQYKGNNTSELLFSEDLY